MRLVVGIGAALAVLLVPAGALAARGTLRVEGSFARVEARDADGSRVVNRRPAKRHVRMLRRLRAGTYRVSAEDFRSPPRRCAKRVRILSRGLTEVTVRVRARGGCRMTRRAFAARFPPLERIEAARRYLSGRGGTNSWSLVDTWGRVHGFAPERIYVSASLVKAMLLTAYLRGLGNRVPSASERALLGPMITVSSNEAADSIYYRVGDARLYALAKLAGMTRFSVAGYWANAHFSAEDQARFFNRIDRLIPKASRAYARGLLSSIASYQRWGFSRFSLARGFKTFFKGGWRGTGAGQLVHEAALFQRGPLRFSMAVLTDGNPSQAYGQETLRGVAERIFGGRPARAALSVEGREEAGNRATRRAGLVDVHRYGPSIRVNLSYRTKHNETGKPLPGYCENWALMYRPVRATVALGRWAERTNRGGAVGAYIARRSRHNPGSAVDLTLVRFRDGKRLRMGGFAFGPYLNEWWRFEHQTRPNRYLDVTLGCARHN